MDYDVIIIGAGLSGLAAGIRLAHFGRRVCLLEKHSQAGGLNSYYLLQGRIMDVGLHAMTNYVPRPVKSTPLTRVWRQLRLSYDDFQLCPQIISRISFPARELQFTNDFHFLVQEIAEKFPTQVDRFLKLADSVHGYDDLPAGGKSVSTRQVLQSFLSDPLLIEMLLCPMMFYGNSQENDMDFAQFSILFRSIFQEGFARPQQGMRQILQLLVDKYRDNGGELRMKCEVQKLHIQKGQVAEVHLLDDQVIRAKTIISSIGLPETWALCSSWDAEAQEPKEEQEPQTGALSLEPKTGALSLEPKTGALSLEPKTGALSFVESILIMDVLPSQSLGFENTILFYSDTERFNYRKPDDLVDLSSGVVCCPNNYQFREPLPEGMIRLTHMANFDLWNGLDKDTYRIQKKRYLQESAQKAERFIPGLSSHILVQDSFTPKTVLKFTGRKSGAVYGTPNKASDGRTPIKNLFICGTDQGWVGIVGTLLSGITIANKCVLYSDKA